MPRGCHKADGYSTPDQYGHRHTMCIDPSSCKRKDVIACFKGRMRSDYGLNDPKNGKEFAAKFPYRERATESWALRSTEKSKWAREFAIQFQNFLISEGFAKHRDAEEDHCQYILDGRQVKDGKLTFLIPQTNHLNALAFHGKEHLRKGDFFLIEELLKGYTTFMDRKGRISQKDKPVSTFLRSLGRRTSAKKISRPRLDSLGCSSADSSFEEKAPISSLYPDLSDLRIIDHLPSYDESEAHARYGIPLPQRPCQDHPVVYPSAPDWEDNDNNNFLTSDKTSFQNGGPRNRSTSFDKNNNSRSRSCSFNSDDDSDNYDDTIVVEHPYLQAFVHHAFCASQGQRIFCNFKGSLDKKTGCYTLSTPTVHTVGGRHCSRDREDEGVEGMRAVISRDREDEGVEGMRAVISRHMCSRLCQHLPDMETFLDYVVAE